MRTRIMALSLLLAAGSVTAADTAGEPAPWGDLETGPYRVGFRLIEEQDSSRSIRIAGANPEVRTRTVRVYLWYPARPAPEAEPMRFGRYAALADDDIWPGDILDGARERMAFSRRPLARSLAPERLDALLAQPVRAFENAESVPGPFPLIVVAQGLYYESPIAHAMLCEHLAGRGFVVATAPLVGTHSPLVSLDVIDLETQVRDLEFAIARVRALPFVDPQKLGVLGYDMGGMAGVVLAMRNPDVDAFAGIDAGILFGHPAGIPEASPHHDPSLLRAPWFHATQRLFGTTPEGFEGVGLFDAAVHSERFLLLTDGMGHADFNSYALIDDRDGVIGYWAPRSGGERERYEAVVGYLVAFFSAYLKGNKEGRAHLARDPEEVAPGLGFTLERRAAEALRPTYSDFLNALLVGDFEGAKKIARKLREQEPQHPLLRGPVINRLGYHLLASWELFDEAIAVFELNVEWEPETVNVYDSLGEAHMLAGNDELAILNFEKVLALDPENQRAQRILESLKTEREP
jgi:tetratricopeptide (TPR) repeat protein